MEQEKQGLSTGAFLLLFLQYKFINSNFEYTIHRLFNKKLICFMFAFTFINTYDII